MTIGATLSATAGMGEPTLPAVERGVTSNAERL
jgi:hypothetical protein